MDFRATTILFAKRKAKQKRDEEKELFMTTILTIYKNNYRIKTEMDRAKNKLEKKKNYCKQNSGSKKKSRYFYNRE